MNLYHWGNATCLEAYSAGDIIVMAETLDEARELVRKQAEVYIRDRYSWWFDFDGSVEPDEREAYNDFKIKLEADLMVEPELVKSQVILIRGSD